MSATNQRDHATNLARSNPKKALDEARKVNDPWFRAQALSWVARFTEDNPLGIAKEAAKAAHECDDDYKKSAVRAWEIAALAERGFASEARECLGEAMKRARGVIPKASRCEGLILLIQAALKISREDGVKINEVLAKSCSAEEHWRCKRALRDGAKMVAGDLAPRPFFW